MELKQQCRQISQANISKSSLSSLYSTFLFVFLFLYFSSIFSFPNIFLFLFYKILFLYNFLFFVSHWTTTHLNLLFYYFPFSVFILLSFSPPFRSYSILILRSAPIRSYTPMSSYSPILLWAHILQSSYSPILLSTLNKTVFLEAPKTLIIW